MIPPSSREAIFKAMDDFDRDLRDRAEWSDWQSRNSFKFALERDGRMYPVKKIISMTTGTTVSNFSGGAEANGFLKKLGFTVISLPERGFDGWCIYVGRAAAENFRMGREKGVWGVQELSTIAGIRSG